MRPMRLQPPKSRAPISSPKQRMTCEVLLRQGEACFRVSCESGTRLVEVWPEALPLAFPCAGRGQCGQCRVKVLRGGGDVTPEESARLSPEARENGERLLCRLIVTDDMVIELPTEGKADILTGFTGGSAGSDTASEPRASVADLSARFGLAVDLGTTTVVMYLVDRDARRIVDATSALNPQRRFGADVISRIQYTESRPDGADALARAIRETLRSLSDTLCEAHGLASRDITALALCANTVMVHLLLGLPAGPLGRSPFTPAFLEPLITTPERIDLTLAPDAEFFIAPGLSAFLGGDILAGLLACELPRPGETALFADLGTNGEMALFHRGHWLSCSTAAGPAFEGLGLSCGMGGVRGAVTRFRFDGETPVYETVGNAPPLGFCGSGFMDLVAALLTTERVDESGALDDESLTPLPGLTVTQKDIRAFQLAKAAIAGGIHTLAQEASLTPDAIDRFYLAGGFGTALTPESALAVGLLPGATREKIQSVGNSAGAGAVRILLDSDFFPGLAVLANRLRYVDLAAHPVFRDSFIDEMGFPTCL